MPEVILKFNLPEDREDMEQALKAGAMRSALWDISQEVFRPARKHGYSDAGLEQLTQDQIDVIAKLEEKFSSILTGYGIDL